MEQVPKTPAERWMACVEICQVSKSSVASTQVQVKGDWIFPSREEDTQGGLAFGVKRSGQNIVSAQMR